MREKVAALFVYHDSCCDSFRNIFLKISQPLHQYMNRKKRIMIVLPSRTGPLRLQVCPRPCLVR